MSIIYFLICCCNLIPSVESRNCLLEPILGGIFLSNLSLSKRKIVQKPNIFIFDVENNTIYGNLKNGIKHDLILLNNFIAIRLTFARL